MAYKDKNAEREHRRLYHQKNRELLIGRARKWNLEHPEQVKLNKEKYKAKLRKTEVNPALSEKRKKAGKLGGLVAAKRRELAKQEGGVNYGISNR